MIISDEAHRSIFGIYNSALSNFDAIRIGMTATPSGYVDRNTYKLFGCWDETEQKANLFPCIAFAAESKTAFWLAMTLCRLIRKYRLKGVNFEGEDYSPEDLERKINIPARNEQVVQAYFAEEEKARTEKMRKAIVLCGNQTSRRSNWLIISIKPSRNIKGRFAEVITSDTEDPRGAIRRFKLEEMPTIAVSMGMMDTGIDAPMVENIIMVRPTQSPILYQQMRGRGSRLDSRINKNHSEFMTSPELPNILTTKATIHIQKSPEPKLASRGERKPRTLLKKTLKYRVGFYSSCRDCSRKYRCRYKTRLC